MRRIRELNVFSLGEADKISTWSNVPYFFVQSLKARGIAVNPINIDRSLAGKVLNRTMWRLLRLVRGNETTYDYFRSPFHFGNVQRKIRRSLQSYPDADANIFLTFSFSSVGMTAKPTVLFCDWTYDHHLKYFANRTPDAWERASVEREDEQIERADLVFVLFPRVAEYMLQRYRNPNIHYIGNVVNAPVQPPTDVLQTKAGSRSLLFIGGIKYRAGALELIEAYQRLRQTHPGLTLDIIGLKPREVGTVPDGVTCHGYLDKARPHERDLYYALVSKARMVVNTTPKWGAFSATIEAMHFYTPVVTSPYAEFVETFGPTPGFGRYCEGGVEALCGCITELLAETGYRERCVNAHDSVDGYSWDAYVGKMLSHIENLLPADTPA